MAAGLSMTTLLAIFLAGLLAYYVTTRRDR
jgi:hypothetical protein